MSSPSTAIAEGQLPEKGGFVMTDGVVIVSR
jgi:hypothetical protein